MSTETEIVVICKIGDMNGFKEASYVQKMQQLELFLLDKGRMRVRKTESEDGTDCVACIKTLSNPNDSVKSVKETEQEVNSKFFEAFKDIAETLQVKTRYTFEGDKTIITSKNQEINFPPVKYEVDVFERPDGRISDWCKIDIEITSLLETLRATPGFKEELLETTVSVTHLPFKPQMAFLVGDCSDEQIEAMKDLWKTEWTQNPKGGPVAEPKASVSKLQSQPAAKQQSNTSDPNNPPEIPNIDENT